MDGRAQPPAAPSASIPQRTLGACGITVPALGLGCWGIGGPATNLGLPMGWDSGRDEAAAVAGLETAWRMGVRLFDTADVYGHGRSERLLGRLVAQVPRAKVVVSSKVGYLADGTAHGFDPAHIRRRVEQSLTNLGTDYLDIYFLHHNDFGDGDEWLAGAVETMQALRREGLIRAVGMRGPHRFAIERLHTSPDARGDKTARFRTVFEHVRPDVLAVRDNLLTPPTRSQDVYEFAAAHGVGVLVTKPLAQGLLTGAHDPQHPRVFGEGDHRARKRWFTSPAIAVVNEGLSKLRNLTGPDPGELVRLALWACLERDHAAVLVGFTRPEQVRTNVAGLGERPPLLVLEQAREIMTEVQQRLDAQGEVFTDETPTGGVGR